MAIEIAKSIETLIKISFSIDKNEGGGCVTKLDLSIITHIYCGIVIVS
jgi:hypothetical protein